jgi:hypothetical protein
MHPPRQVAIDSVGYRGQQEHRSGQQLLASVDSVELIAGKNPEK